MKTSNKILLSLLIIVIVTPLLLATSLKSKMKKGEYTIEKLSNSVDSSKIQKGTFASYKVVKVIAPNGVLTCRLKQSNELRYNYYQENKGDSILVYNNSDTLFIQYATKLSKEQLNNGEYDHVSMDVYIPSVDSLVIDGARVVVEFQTPPQNNMSIMILNNGELKDGSKVKKVDQSKDVSYNNSTIIETLKHNKVEVSLARKSNEMMKDAEEQLAYINIRDLLFNTLFYKI